ncbi:MAG: hypothetical protein KC416_01795, partial [Myxococcales bacterium]|nr:hypothetical protein [Myxococcales bacterium]
MEGKVDQRAHIPRPRGAFFGRTAEVEKVRAALIKGEPWISVVGPPGVGKTRLLIEVSRDWIDTPPEEEPDVGPGYWFVDATDISSKAEFLAAVGERVGVRTSAEVGAGLVEALSGGGMLVLDNGEQLVSSCSETIQGWIESIDRLSVLIGTRIRTGVPSELVVEVSPLATGRDSDSFDLFVDRARRANPDFRLDGPSVPALEKLLVILDGLPLAVEHAAAQAHKVSIQETLAALEGEGGVAGSDSPRRALDRSIRTSWALLAPEDRKVLMALAVFRGGATAAAMAEVIGQIGDGDPSLVQGALQSLRDQSLVTSDVDSRTGATRYGMHLALRDFAEDRLREEELLEVTRRAHAVRFGNWLAARSKESRGAEESRALNEIAAEAANGFAALAYWREHVDENEAVAQVALLLQALLVDFRARPRAGLHTLFACGETWSDLLAGREGVLRDWASIENAVSRAAHTIGLMDAAAAHARTQLLLAEQLGEPEMLAEAHHALGVALLNSASDVAEAHLLACLDVDPVLDAYRHAVVHDLLARIGHLRGDLAMARKHVESSLECARESGSSLLLRRALLVAAEIHVVAGEFAQVHAILENLRAIPETHAFARLQVDGCQAVLAFLEEQSDRALGLWDSVAKGAIDEGWVAMEVWAEALGARVAAFLGDGTGALARLERVL